MGKFTLAVIFASILIVAGIVWLTTRASQTGPLQGEEIPSLGGQHIGSGQDHIPYNSNPPSSGPHYATPQPAGIFDEELVDEAVVHSLEHGGVWVSYHPEKLAKDDIEKLKNIVRKKRAKVVLAPRSKNDSPIALVSWTRVLKLEQVDEQQILQFIRSNRDNAPETLPL